VNIDIYTFAVVLGVIYTIQFVIFFVEFYYHKNYEGPGWWLFWSGSAILGFVFMLTRQISSVVHISILGQNVMLFLASVFIYIGIMRFLKKKERSGLLIVIFTVYIIPFCYYLFVDENLQIRTILIWLTQCFIALLGGYDLYRYKTKSLNIAAYICIVVFIVHALFSGSKVILLLTGSQIEIMTSQHLINYSSYVEILIITVFWTYALIMMINQRLTSEMEYAKNHFEVIFNTTPDAILISNLKEGTVTSVNEKFYDLTGYKPKEVLGKSTVELNFWCNPEERTNYVAMIRKQDYCFDYEANFHCKNQMEVTGLISGRIINLDEKPHLISIIRDITERKKREEEVLKQNNQLQTLNHEKDKFFSIIAHDLKSPFSSFLGLTEIMAEEIHNLPIGEVIQLASKMRDSARNLYGLLGNLLEWSLIKQGVTKFNPEEIALYPETNEGILTYLNTSQKKNIAVVSKVSLDEKVFADQNMLRSLIRNLLSNAIKFTHEGGTITISAETQKDHSCLISVQDTGIGMNKKMQNQLFKMNANISRSGTNGELSSGLGLLLCKEFITRHNGDIWVESAENEGCTFCIKLPPPLAINT